MRKLAGERIAVVWRRTGVEPEGALQYPRAVFGNWFSDASRMTAPILRDKASRLIVSNESSCILRAREVAR